MATKAITDLTAAGTLTGSELVEVSQPSATVTITAATLSALASDNSYNDSGSGFVAAGFAVGNRVRVTGFTGDTANNIFVAVITALTTGKMTIGGADGNVIVDDAAGESVTITKWDSRRTTAQAIANLASASAPAVQAETGTAYNLLNADKGKYLRFTNASAKAVTVQEDATEPLDANGEWHIRNVGAADLTLVEDGGVVITPPSGGTLVVPQYGTVTLKRTAADAFDLMGQTVPV